MIVTDAGRRVRTVSGGCLEVDLIERGQRTDASLAQKRFYAPVGLALGAETAEEIGVAVMRNLLPYSVKEVHSLCAIALRLSMRPRISQVHRTLMARR